MTDVLFVLCYCTIPAGLSDCLLLYYLEASEGPVTFDFHQCHHVAELQYCSNETSFQAYVSCLNWTEQYVILNPVLQFLFWDLSQVCSLTKQT